MEFLRSSSIWISIAIMVAGAVIAPFAVAADEHENSLWTATKFFFAVLFVAVGAVGGLSHY